MLSAAGPKTRRESNPPFSLPFGSPSHHRRSAPINSALTKEDITHTEFVSTSKSTSATESAWTEAMAATLVEAMSDLSLKEPEAKESIMVEFKAPPSLFGSHEFSKYCVNVPV